jgi:protein-tyrosine kinase
VPSDIAKPAKPRRGFSIIERAIDRLDAEIGLTRAATPADLPPLRQPAAAAPRIDAAPPAAAPRQVALAADRLRARGMLAPGSERSKLAEQYRLVKRPLINRALGAPAARVMNKLIMVTSAMPEEGKTFTAFNLALSISGEREIQVVLVDADPHRGQLLETLGLEPRCGLFDYLAGTVRHLQEILLPTERDNLWLLPPGTAHGNSSELMMGPRMAQLVTELELAYRPRIVLFDTPPLLASTESAMLASHVGQIVMVVEASRTTRPRIEEALRMVSACPEVNLLLNKAQDIYQYEQYGEYKAA